MTTTGGSRIIKKNRSRRVAKKSRKKRRVESLAVGYEVVATFIIIFKMCGREGV